MNIVSRKRLIVSRYILQAFAPDSAYSGLPRLTQNPHQHEIHDDPLKG